MNIVTLLTTWNRPKLLEQSLRHIEREAASINSPLVIADDQSDNYQTKQLLSNSKAEVIQRQYHREPDQNPHYCVGWLAQYSFLYVIKKYKPDFVIKCDDDIVLIDGAFKRLILAYEQAKEDGHDVIAVTGIKGVWEPLVYAPQGRAYRIVATPCAATCLYPASDLYTCFTDISPGTIGANGWDWSYINEYKNKHHPTGVSIATAPGSVTYHAGHTGVHVANIDINKDYEGTKDGIYTE